MVVNIIIAEGDRGRNNQLRDACLSDRNIRVAGQALTGRDTISLVAKLRPEVILMTANLPDIPIVKILNRIMVQYPTPVLLLYRQVDDQLVNQLRLLDLGILDMLSTPERGGKFEFSEVSLITRIHILSKLKVEKFVKQINQTFTHERHQSPTVTMTSKSQNTQLLSTSSSVPPVKYTGVSRSAKIIIIGTSTGGPRLLSDIVPNFPMNLPPVIVVQHMPIGFISAFASRLNRLSRIKVKEAVDGEVVLPGTVYLAPGGQHLEFFRQADHTISIRLTDGPPVNFVKPAVDITLKSSAKIYGSGTIGVILTGMGHDGRNGSRIVKEKGGQIICLNEADSDVYGMNKAVIEAGYADGVVSKRDLVPYIIRAIEGKYLG